MTYDAVGNMLSRTDGNSHTTTYEYDGLDRLIREIDPLLGVTENVIVGQSIPIGTGLVELYMSTAKLRGKKKR